MNIHFANIAGRPHRISVKEARAMGLSIGSNKGTAQPKTREGKKYPGGKSLRRALAKLAMRNVMHNEAPCGTRPGSMKG